MDSLTVFGTRFLADDANSPPRPNNDNWRLMPARETPAEFLHWVRQEKERLHLEAAADVHLLTCPKHRRTREIREAMEKCCLWHYYGIR
jgi:hypothetical protein